MAVWAAAIPAAAGVVGGILGKPKTPKLSAEQKALINAQTAQAGVQTTGLSQKNMTYMDVYNQAKALGMDPAQYVAQLSPQQRQALQMTSGSLGFGQSDNDALRKTIGDASYGSFGASDINEFMDPYVNDVVNTTNADMDRSRLAAISAGNGTANSAGAFGGSRHGVADSLTNEASLRAQAATDAQLRSSGFQSAAQLAQQRANQMGGFKVSGNAQIAALLRDKYQMNDNDIARLFQGGALEQSNDQSNKDWQLKRLGIIQGAQGGANGGGGSSFTGSGTYGPVGADPFASITQGAAWGAGVGKDIYDYFKKPAYVPGSYTAANPVPAAPANPFGS